MKRIFFLVPILAILISQSPDKSGPFGLEMGMSLNAIREAGMHPEKHELEPGLWSVEPPQSHPDFRAYFILVGPHAGLCQIRAIGRDVRTSSHGVELRSEFEHVVDQLAGVYGKPKISDALLPGSIWSEPRDFMMGLLKQDRVLAGLWLRGPYRAHVATVQLQAKATASDTGVLVLQYDFQNEAECKAEIQAIEQDVL